ncbi:MAG: DUF2950 domain-containing protein [Phycisphaerales bacterium]|nr:DUF2950 domain-containing protein [Phycisphaerales bacterium]
MISKGITHRWIGSTLCTTILLAGIAGCQSQKPPPTDTSAAQVEAAGTDQPAPGQAVFASDKDAAAALLAALKEQDHHQLHQIFGPALKELASGDKVEDHRHFEAFVAHAKEKFQLQKENANTSIILVGNKSWPFPIPIVQSANGRWFFDTEAGKQEILTRRIGGDELEAIHVCHAYVIAQKIYFATGHDGSTLREYAQRLVSKPGTHDGLYWPATPGTPQSPFSALAAEAENAGYTPGVHPSGSHGPRPFFGYYFHILTRQGPAASGGARNYVVNGKMVNGFALVAYPDRYGASGVMSFIVNQDGQVYQKDLGPDTVELAKQMTSYNPDASWTLVRP